MNSMLINIFFNISSNFNVDILLRALKNISDNTHSLIFF